MIDGTPLVNKHNGVASLGGVVVFSGQECATVYAEKRGT
jgi:hypothetical protein